MDTTSVTGNSSDLLWQEWQVVANSDLLSIVNPHWLRFHPPSCTHHSIIAVIYVFVVVPGILGNLVMIITFFTSPALRNHGNLMSANLTLADFLMNLEIPFLIRNSLSCGPRNFSPTACHVYGLTGGLSGTVAIACIAGMAYQRLIKISRPFNEGNLINRRNSVFLVIGTWIYGLIFALFPFFYAPSAYAPEGYLTSCSYDYLNQDLVNKIYILIFFAGAYVIPLVVILFCYFQISQHVHDANQNMIALHNRPPSPRPPPNVPTLAPHRNNSCSPTCGRQSARSVSATRPPSAASAMTTSSNQAETIARSKIAMEKKLMKSVIILITNWTIAWTPYAIISLMGVFSYTHLITPVMSMMPALFAKCASVIDPYIYFLSHPRYQREVIVVLSKASRWTRKRRTEVSISLSRITTIVRRGKTMSELTPPDTNPESTATSAAATAAAKPGNAVRKKETALLPI